MAFRSWIFVASIALAVGACAVVDPVDNRYDTIGRSLAKARNESIFLNLVRASHDYPLSFSTISQVTPSLTNVSSFGLPSFLFGPRVPTPGTTAPLFTPGRDVIFSNTTASDSTTVSSNFNVATQETAAFYEGFLRPIDLVTLDYFIRQGYPRELLFWLFADSFQIGGPGPRGVSFQYSPPISYGCPREDPQHLCFREWVWIAVLSGLTVEEKTIQKPSSSSGGAKGAKAEGSSSKVERTIVARFCFSPQLARQARNQMGDAKAAEIKAQFMAAFDIAYARPICGTWTDKEAEAQAAKPQSDTFDFQVGAQRFQVVSRSAYGVFEFLGNLVRMEREGLTPSPLAYIPPDRLALEAEPPRLLTTNGDFLIEVVRQNGRYCFSHTWFYDGDYCVPEDATNTKRIFSLLAQLIAITTAASDLSITPIVRIIQ